jgi:hypothetical protein
MSEDKNLEITSSPVPYEDGDHCVFYAVQEASLFFRNQPLSKVDQSKYKKERERLIRLGKIIIGKDTEDGHWLTASLRFTHAKLSTIGVSISSLACSNETRQFLEQDNFIKRSGTPINVKEIGKKFNLVYPVLLYIQAGDKSSHVWCCVSPEKFTSDHHKHIPPNNRIILVANLRKN